MTLRKEERARFNDAKLILSRFGITPSVICGTNHKILLVKNRKLPMPASISGPKWRSAVLKLVELSSTDPA